MFELLQLAWVMSAHHAASKHLNLLDQWTEEPLVDSAYSFQVESVGPEVGE